jgi:predicted kinase
VNIDIAVDAFEAAGRPFEANSTWRRKMDKAPSARSMQARFDRQIFRSGTTDFSLSRDSFCLLGVEDVAGVDEATSCSAGFTTPSDHMGIICDYVLGARDLIRSAGADGSLKQTAQAAGINSLVVCVLIGAPGSGKSSLADLLSPSFVRISQDALGNRLKCEDAALAALHSGVSVVIDRCNFDANQRSTWLSLARRCSARAVAVQLQAPLDVCLQRVAARRCHEGGLDGESKNMVDVVTTLHGSHKWVTDDEGFCDVHIFQHPATSKNIAMELLKTHSMQGTNCNPVINVAARYSAALPHRTSFSAQPIGVQSDSSSESSQERDVLARSSSRVIPSLAAPLHSVTQHTTSAVIASDHTTSAVCASENKADANNDDCVLIEHVPSRSCAFIIHFCNLSLIVC